MYFEQQTHACACVRMVENNGKHSRITKKVLKPYMNLSYAWWRRYFFQDFQMFFIFFDHGNAYAHWSKYTTDNSKRMATTIPNLLIGNPRNQVHSLPTLIPLALEKCYSHRNWKRSWTDQTQPKKTIQWTHYTQRPKLN